MNGLVLLAVCALSPAAAAALVWAGAELVATRRPSIVMGRLTDDPATATVEETLRRIELPVDPEKLSTAEIQRLHRTLAADMASAPSGLYLPRKWVQ